MYVLMNGLLLVLLGTAGGLSLAGQLPFAWSELLASGLVFGVSGVLASYVLGRVYGVHSHLQSALITSLILALIFTPTAEIAVLLQYVIISVIAQASKFVVVYSRRHLFNPAAFGAVAGGVLYAQYASWWVGTPVLGIPVAIAAGLILYKTRQLRLAAVFLAACLALLLVRGVDPWTAVAAWPLLFLVGFMLSEPATLPPFPWQKYIVAAVVALSVAVPFHIGWFYSSPAYALLVGNVVAFALAFRERAGLRLVLRQRRRLTLTTEELVLASPTPVPFAAGQYIELTLPHPRQDIRGIRRSFSITSNPGEYEVRLGVKYYEPSSTFKQALRRLSIGTPMQATGISGDFVLPKQTGQKLLFIAGGIGITPFVSMVQAGRGEARDIVLLYSVRNPSDVAYKHLLDASGAKCHYFAAEQAGGDFESAAFLNETLLRARVPDIGERLAYVSGPPVMVANAKKLLTGLARSVRTDYFSGY